MDFEEQAKKIRKLGIIGMIVGVLLVIIGLAALFIPGIPGILLLLAGIVILGVEVKTLKAIGAKILPFGQSKDNGKIKDGKIKDGKIKGHDK